VLEYVSANPSAFDEIRFVVFEPNSEADCSDYDLYRNELCSDQRVTEAGQQI